MSGIRPDAWIARMAREHGMIEPFSDRQVREGVISYGLSSYGYDLRVSDEYKIFTNVYTATVDPKAFDPRSFVDFKGDVCIVPPNSFALARSIEYFRIPRNVLTICVGKSTYARCFAGDTRVALVDGTSPTLEEMVARHEAGEMFWGYSMSSNGRIQVALLDAPRKVGREPLVEIALDDDSRIRCTPDHEFILRDGRTAPAEELQPGTPLMPLYRNDPRGYEMVYQPLNGQMHPTHRLADEWNVRNGLYEDVEGTHRHHRDWNRRNNNPWNIERMEAGEHIRLHNSHTFGEGFDAEAHSEMDLVEAGSSREAAFSASCHRNHKVSSVTPLKGEHDVYCLTVPEGGNFALAAGVFTLNCGILVNVTPFEPEWEGHVTLEISNTTPLPAKIYSGEGLAQVLFFESDDPCDVSYKDRGGKYQAQRGVTLPRL